MPEVPQQNPLERYRYPPDREIITRAIEASAEKDADYFDAIYEDFQKYIEGDFWNRGGEGWTADDRLILYHENLPWTLVPHLEVADFLENHMDLGWLSSHAPPLVTTHAQFEPFPPLDPETQQEAPGHLAWRLAIERLEAGLVGPRDLLAPYWAQLWDIKPLEVLAMLEDYEELRTA